ncbi:MAG TPA: hypothetical protein VE197_12560 [Mycobacterium sp.]|nr:hypothetical protein [Mycobacterium sp.]
MPGLALFRQRLFDIAADDVVTSNAQATVYWQADRMRAAPPSCATGTRW